MIRTKRKGSCPIKSLNFRNELKAEGRSERTILEYQRRIHQWFNFYFKLHKKDGIIKQYNALSATPDDVKKYKETLLETDQKPVTINFKIGTISKYYKLAQKNDMVKEDPTRFTSRMKTTEPNTPRLSETDVDLLKAEFNHCQENIRAAFFCMYGTGARVGEVAKLRYSDVYIKDSALWINIREAKWGSDRIVPVMDRESAQILYNYKMEQAPSRQPLFHVSKRTIQGYATQFAHELNLPFHCHVLRHNFATKLVEHRMPLRKIQKLLGHSSEQMTYHYIKHANQGMGDYVPRFFKTIHTTSNRNGEKAA